MASPFMGLDIPVVQSTPSPEWASLLNTCLEIIDSHNHSPGNGALVTAAALSIDADLPFNNHNATEIRTVRLEEQTTAPVGVNDLGIIYNLNGELYYKDSDGNAVQITNNGSIAGASGTITGLVAPATAAYAPVLKTFLFSQDTNKPGKLVISDILLYEFDNATANPITLKSPAALASPYSLTLPEELPADTGKLVVDDQGVISVVERTIEDSGEFDFVGPPTSTFDDVTGATITITTQGGPVWIGLQGSATDSYIEADPEATDAEIEFQLQMLRDATVINRNNFKIYGITPGEEVRYPPSVLWYIDSPAAGTYTYKLQYRSGLTIDQQIRFQNCHLVAYEL